MRLRNSLAAIVCVLMLQACASNESQPVERSDEDKAQTFLQMGIGYMELGKYNVALQRLDNALQLDDENSATHDAMAVLYQKLGEDDKARYHFERSIELNPKNPGAINNYGRYLCDTGDYEKGIEHLNQALNIATNNRRWFALTNLGLCEYKRGSVKRAELYYRDALQYFPEYAPALQEMITISYDKGNYISARAFLERFLQVSRHTPQSLHYAMLIEQATGNPEKAQMYKSILLEKFPLSDEAGQFIER